MNIKDRTSEFQQAVLTYKRLNKKNNRGNINDAQPRAHKISEFQRNASKVANEISSTAQMLSKLAILAKRKPMFNDNPVEIAELSFLIKRKIYAIEQELIALNKMVHGGDSGYKNGGSGAGGVDASGKADGGHSNNVMNLLNRKMKNISGDFKNVLEERQRLVMMNKDRWEKLRGQHQQQQEQRQRDAMGAGVTNTSGSPRSGQATLNTVGSGGSESNASTKPGDPRTVANASQSNNLPIGYNSSNPFMSSLIDEADAASISSRQSARQGNDAMSGGLMLPSNNSQLLLMEEGLNTNVYLQERNRAVETIESTIQEVGNLFQQLASMVQEQGEVIQRIDANVDDVDMNISGAQRELLKYFDRVKSNRWLAAKIFFIIFVFFLVWVLVN